MAEIRQRKGKGPAKDDSYRTAIVEELDTSESDTPAPPKPKPSTKERVNDDDEYSPWVDILRVISFLLVASCGLSYLISGGESFTWSMRAPPKYMQLDWWKTQLLAQYEGTDETKPIYLAINGSIFDVTSNRRTYGPGGSYRFFAGADAARSYITGCFAEDRTPDLRGVEEMYLPLDDPSIDSHFSAAGLAALKEEELKQAQEKVYDALSHWVKFFENSPKYAKVGYVKKEKNWLDKEPRKKLCDTAAKGRKPRKIPGSEE